VSLRDTHRILVITKFRYLGDTIVATPFFRRLKEAIPAAEVTLLSGPAMPTLLRGCPYLAEIVPFNPKGDRRLLRNLALARQLREKRFDAAFLLNRSLHSAVVARMAGIPIRVGFDTEFRGPLLTNRVPYDWTKPDRDCALDLLRACELAAEPALPELWVDKPERAEAAETLRGRGVGPDDFMIGMQPGAHDPEVREWGSAKYAEAADRLSASHKARVLLLGSAEERPVSEEVARAMIAAPIVLTGGTNLRQVLALIARCQLWVGNDGGLLHAAVSLGPATVGIFGPTKAERWGYHAPRHRTIAHFPEADARKPDAAMIRSCLDSIAADEVVAAAESVLAARNEEAT
jgi:heptosyltransferase-2